MSNHVSHERMVQDCQAAIIRIRQAISAGSTDTTGLHEDWELIRLSLRNYLTPVANIVDRSTPGSGEELQQLAYDRLYDHIRSPTYHSLTTQFGSYLKHAKQRILGIILQRTRRIARLDAVRDQRGCLADRTSDPRAERALDSVDNRLMLERALAQLDFPDRQIIILTELKGYSCIEVARKFGVAPSTVTRRHKRAIARLRSILDAPDA